MMRINHNHKPRFIAMMLLILVLFMMGSFHVYAEDAGTGNTQGIITPILAESDDDSIDAIAITVIIPPLPDRTPPATQAQTRRIFPVNVAEGYNYEGVRELVRVYELLPGESPEWINTESFERNGYYYRIADITRRVDVAHTVRERTEVVEIQTANNDLAAVIAGLNPTMDFVDEDGYVGVLHLDIRSIEMTQDGTRSTSRTVRQTREYPHLSNPDLSLIPQTITVSGRTYTLAEVDWRAATTAPIDFNAVAQTFTAVATYTRAATSTVSTGYTTRAEFSGTLTRVSTGDTRFVAAFIGTPILSPIINQVIPNQYPEPTPTPESAAGEEVDAEQPEAQPIPPVADKNSDNGNNEIIGGTGNGYEYTTPETNGTHESSGENNNRRLFSTLIIPTILGILAIALTIALAVLMLKYKKMVADMEQKAQDENSRDDTDNADSETDEDDSE